MRSRQVRRYVRFIDIFRGNSSANPEWPMNAAKGLFVQARFTSERQLNAAEWKFSGRIFLYAEDLVPDEQTEKLALNGKLSMMSVLAAKSGPLPQPCLNSSYRNHFSFACSAFAAMRMGISGSASFQRVRALVRLRKGVSCPALGYYRQGLRDGD